MAAMGHTLQVLELRMKPSKQLLIPTRDYCWTRSQRRKSQSSFVCFSLNHGFDLLTQVGFGLVGVAPDASLYMYRIMGCNGGATTDVILQGMERAGEAGVDVISMS